MPLPRSMSFLKCASFSSCIVVLAVAAASAQVAAAQNQPSSQASVQSSEQTSAQVQDQTGAANSSATYSSSQSGLSATDIQFASISMPANPSGAGAGQYGSGGEYGAGKSHGGLMSHLTYEAGGGFNAPVGNDTPYITWGGNITGGVGYRFSKMFSLLAEYQFLDNKLPGAFIGSVNSGNTSGTAVTAGNAHINAITGSPVITLFPKKSNGVYLVGGWGYYHKSTNFNGYECCEISYYGEYPVEVTLASISSNQWGGNAGLGIYHRLGGDTNSELFAEARYTYLHTPPITQNNGLGTTELIPVTVGIRF